MIKARSPFFIEHEEPAPPVVLQRFSCDDTVISGLSIAADGTITNPTVTVGTFHSVEPSSFGTVPVDTLRNVQVLVTYDQANFLPPSGTSYEIYCLKQVLQPATTIIAYQKNYRVTNHSTTENALINYIAFDGNQEITHFLAPSSTVDICVAPVNNYTFGFPTVSGDNVTYFDLVAGCSTDILS